MNTRTTTKAPAREPRWVREALFYADRPSRRLSSQDVESVIAGLQLEANGGRVFTSADGWDF